MNEQVNILILEDNPADAELVQRELRNAGLGPAVRWVQDKASFTHALR